MSRIRIKNFGPIKEGLLDNDGWIDIKKVTLFIGNQGSGKSTVTKLISTFTWIEKALVRGDYDKKWFQRKNKLKNQHLTYHRIENYLKPHTKIEYNGDAYTIKYENGTLSIDATNNRKYPLPQIMYVPAERNFIANVKTPKALKLTSDSLVEFVTEFDNAKTEMKGALKLPINDVEVEYDKLNDTVNIKADDYKLKLTEASSGFQSLIPLFLVSRFLANAVKKQSENSKEPMSSEELERFRKGVAEIWMNTSLTDDQRRVALSVLSSKFNKTAFVNIVEEPEQNLYPTSQWEMLKSLLEFNNINSQNKLVMTTHSPYLINFLSIAIYAMYLEKKIEDKNGDLGQRLAKIIPKQNRISSDAVIVYQLDEKDGTIKRLPSPEGIPSDKNLLNQLLKEGNRIFDQLLEIEEEL